MTSNERSEKKYIMYLIGSAEKRETVQAHSHGYARVRGKRQLWNYPLAKCNWVGKLTSGWKLTMSHLTFPPHDLKALRFVLHISFLDNLLSLHGRGVFVCVLRVWCFMLLSACSCCTPLLLPVLGCCMLLFGSSTWAVGVFFLLPSLVCFRLGFSFFFLFLGCDVHFFSFFFSSLYICNFQDSYFFSTARVLLFSQQEWFVHPCPCVFRSFLCLCFFSFTFFERDC